jgi:acylphosphatase
MSLSVFPFRRNRLERSISIPDEIRIARIVHYSGRVQGVGFRYTASSIARHHGVTGWVRNLADGRVQMLVEGAKEDVDKYLQAIRQYWGDRIVDEEIEDREIEGLTEFEIRGCSQLRWW